MFRALKPLAATFALYYSSSTIHCDDNKKDYVFFNKDEKLNTKKNLACFEDTTKDWSYDIYGFHRSELSEFEKQRIYAMPPNRNYQINKMSTSTTPYDVIIIGGGSAGAAALLEASSRGLRCALVESNDFGSGTSSRSTKLIHGGMRYLEQAFKLEEGFYEKLSLVIEGLRERNYMVNSLPYLNKEVKLVVPCFGLWDKFYYGAGVVIYHLIAKTHFLMSPYDIQLSGPKFVSKNRMKELFPKLEPCTGIMFSEGQMIDARTLLQSLFTSTIDNYNAGFMGANICNYTEVQKIIKDSKGKAIGVQVYDKIGKKEFTINGKAIINCTGPFSDAVRKLDNQASKNRIVGSNGVHLILENSNYTPKDIGLFIPKTKDGRVMFVIPYQGKTLSGTTDHQCKITETPTTPDSDINEIVKELQNYFLNTKPKEDLLAAWNGIRPLVIDKKFEGKEVKSSDTKLLTRLHALDVSDSGVISLMGGKWTSYRQMGSDAVDLLCKNDPKLSLLHPKSITNVLKLYGSYTSQSDLKDKNKSAEFISAYAQFLKTKYSLASNVAQHLVNYYGTKSVVVAHLGRELKMLNQITKEEPYLDIEVIFAVRYEMAVNLKDVIFRRLGIGFLNTEMAKGKFAESVADIMQHELNWSKEEKEAQLKNLRESINSLH